MLSLGGMIRKGKPGTGNPLGVRSWFGGKSLHFSGGKLVRKQLIYATSNQPIICLCRHELARARQEVTLTVLSRSVALEQAVPMPQPSRRGIVHMDGRR